ncbi:MAG: TIM-barrel domain-containing protein [Myxococcota bacterium]
MVRRWLWVVALLGATGASCSDSDSGGTGGGGAPESVQLVANDDGSVVVVIDGEETFATAPLGPVARNFTETFTGQPERFTRTDEVVDPLLVQEVSSDENGATVQYANETGSRTATLTATQAGPDSSEFTLELAGDPADSIAVGIRCDELGTFHGFGEQYNATNQRGDAFQLLVTEQGNGRDDSGGVSGDEHTTYFPMPYYVDARGFGALFDTSRRVLVDLCATDENVAWFEIVSGGRVAWRVFHGPAPVDVLRQLNDLVGRPAQPPLWAYSLWIGSQGGREVVLDEVDALEAANVPVSAMWVQDWGGVRINFDGGFGVRYVWEPREMCVPEEECPGIEDCSVCYPDFGEMVSGLRDRGYRFLTYVNPFIVEGIDPRFSDMADMGLLVQDPDDPEGGPYLPVIGPNIPEVNGHPDFSNPDTVEFIASSLADIVRDYGVDGWMADFGEWVPLDAVASDGSDGVERRNTFPIDWQRATRQAMDAVRPDGDWVMFARSGYTGVQEVAQIHWAGDQETNWSVLDGLPTVVPALINLGLAGQPFVTHDIAGFARGDGPSTKELYLRWTELGAFTPIMRTHQGADKFNNWRWDSDQETVDHFRKFTYVHCALVDELVTLAADWETSGAPILRHMMLNYPDDPDTWDLSDQYMLGDSLLVAPILEEGADSRPVYFPEGDWYDVWTGNRIRGPVTVDVPGPIGSPPVYALGEDREDLRNAESNLEFEDCR